MRGTITRTTAYIGLLLFALGASGNAAAGLLTMSEKEMERERSFLTQLFGASSTSSNSDDSGDNLAGVDDIQQPGPSPETDTVGTNQVPEPGTLFLFATGALGVGWMLRRRGASR